MSFGHQVCDVAAGGEGLFGRTCRLERHAHRGALPVGRGAQWNPGKVPSFGKRATVSPSRICFSTGLRRLMWDAALLLADANHASDYAEGWQRDNLKNHRFGSWFQNGILAVEWQRNYRTCFQHSFPLEDCSRIKGLPGNHESASRSPPFFEPTSDNFPDARRF